MEFDPVGYATPAQQKKYRGLEKSAKQGRAKAAIKLKCLDCSGWSPAEAKGCQIRDCALWLLSSRYFGRVTAPESTPAES